MNPHYQSYRQPGFTLLEMTVVLAITGLLGLAAWKFLPVLRTTTQPSQMLMLQDAQSALEGFALREHRLPCPDDDGDGQEDCGSSAYVGQLPARTLGLSLPRSLRYGVYRNTHASPAQDADLATWQNRYLPTLPPGYSSLQKNGLDFCLALRNAIAAPGGSLAAGGIPVAYALAEPGANGRFDGANATASNFSQPGAAMTASYDDRVVTAGLAELSGRLGCPQQLGLVQGAALASLAAYDIDRNAQMYQTIREFGYQVAKDNTSLAATALILATADFAVSCATGISAIIFASVLPEPSVNGPIALAGVATYFAAVAVAAATAMLVNAAISESTAYNKQQAAINNRTQTILEYAQALTQAQTADQKGLTP